MKIEILHERSPDYECSLRVFVDGVEATEFDLEDIDPGRGYTIEDWRESTEWTAANPGYSQAFRDATVAARNEAEGSDYIASELQEETQ